MDFTRTHKAAFPKETTFLAPLLTLPVAQAVLATTVVDKVMAQLTSIAADYWVRKSDRPGLNVTHWGWPR